MRNLLILFLMLPIAAFASDWKHIGNSDRSAIAYDAQSVKVTGIYRKAWVMTSYFKEQSLNAASVSFQSVKNLVYFDCTQRTQSDPLQNIYYDDFEGIGNVTRSSSYAFDPSSMIDVAPDSLGEGILDAVCKAKVR